METGKVSIVVPCYNMGNFLPETIESIQAQTYRNTEVIVVDDGSTDDSLAVAKSFEPFVRVISKDNSGLPGTRNVGVWNSTGEFVLPLDSDDKIRPDYLEKTVPKMADPAVGVVATYMETFGLRSTFCGPAGSPYPIFHPTREQILTGNCVAVTSLMRREAFDRAGGYPSAMTGGSEDWCLWAGLICLGYRVEVVPEYLFLYRTRERSMSSTMVPFERARQKIRDIFGFPDPIPVDRWSPLSDGAYRA